MHHNGTAVIKEYNCSTGHLEILAAVDAAVAESLACMHAAAEKSADHAIYVDIIHQEAATE